MSAFKKNLTVALTALTLGTATLAGATGAQAGPFLKKYHHNHYPHWGVGAALVGGLALAGAYAATRPAYAEPVYAEEYPVRRCGMVERVNVYGEVIGTRRVCRSVY